MLEQTVVSVSHQRRRIRNTLDFLSNPGFLRPSLLVIGIEAGFGHHIPALIIKEWLTNSAVIDAMQYATSREKKFWQTFLLVQKNLRLYRRGYQFMTSAAKPLSLQNQFGLFLQRLIGGRGLRSYLSHFPRSVILTTHPAVAAWCCHIHHGVVFLYLPDAGGYPATSIPEKKGRIIYLVPCEEARRELMEKHLVPEKWIVVTGPTIPKELAKKRKQLLAEKEKKIKNYLSGKGSLRLFFRTGGEGFEVGEIGKIVVGLLEEIKRGKIEAYCLVSHKKAQKILWKTFQKNGFSYWQIHQMTGVKNKPESNLKETVRRLKWAQIGFVRPSEQTFIFPSVLPLTVFLTPSGPWEEANLSLAQKYFPQNVLSLRDYQSQQLSIINYQLSITSIYPFPNLWQKGLSFLSDLLLSLDS